MTGDMQNKNDEDTDVVCSLIRELSKTADVYYGYAITRKHGSRLLIKILPK